VKGNEIGFPASEDTAMTDIEREPGGAVRGFVVSSISVIDELRQPSATVDASNGTGTSRSVGSSESALQSLVIPKDGASTPVSD